MEYYKYSITKWNDYFCKYKNTFQMGIDNKILLAHLRIRQIVRFKFSNSI